MRLLFAFAIALAGFCLFAPTAANAQATRTWVSGLGDDANPCSRTAPCKTFAGAYSRTAVAGEINCIDAGGYGAVTISKSLAIKCDNTEAGVLVSGTNAIVINGAAGDVVWLSGLDFEGLGPAALSLNGIKITGGAAVHVVNCVIRGFGSNNGTDGNGIFVNNGTFTKLYVVNTQISDNANVGIEVKPTLSNFATAEIKDSSAVNNLTGFRANATTTTGGVNIDIVDSVSYGNSGAGINATSTTGAAQIMMNRVTTSHNGTFGIRVDGGSAAVRFGYSSITGNGTATSAINGGVLGSYNNNEINGNTIDTVPPTILLH
ncbi:MAG: hypothetical protein JWM87_322 [Candidatus Eremiobacteraeota bacterium]|nr:hypothetical protein [Candidatus Eremiobacteraeota bacterium]